MANFDAVKELHLPEWEYAIFWSSFLVIRNIRESDDIDILVKKDLWNKLVKKYPNNITRLPISHDECIRLKDKWTEIVKDWIHLYGQEDEMIDTADIINWLPFVKTEYFKERKSKMWREKDKKDLELLNEYEKNTV